MLITLLLHPFPAFANPPKWTEAPAPDANQWVWQATTVAWPIAPIGPVDAISDVAAVLDARESMFLGDVGSRRGPVEIDEARAVGVWISAFESVRVRQLGDAVPLRFVRSVDGNAAVLEPGEPLAPGPGGERRWRLEQLDGSGALWSIEADEPTRVLIERTADRSMRYAAVEIEHARLDWIRDGAGDDAMPSAGSVDDEAGSLALLHAALARELLALDGDDRALRRAVEAWRGLAMMVELDRRREPIRPYFAPAVSNRVDMLPGTERVRLDASSSRGYVRAEAGQRWTIQRSGAGRLELALRSWAPAGATLDAAELRVHVGERVVARLQARARQARHSRDDDAALPHFEPLTTIDGGLVGELSEQTLVLPPGTRELELELVDGPAVIAIESATRIESSLGSLRGRTPARKAQTLTRQLDRSDAPAAVWLRTLACEQLMLEPAIDSDDPRFDELASHSPLLAAAALAIAASHAELRPAAFTRAFARVRPWLAALDRDQTLAPRALGQLMTQWLWLLNLHGRADLLDELLDDQARVRTLGVEGLKLAAELVALRTSPTVERPRALALLDRARALAPADKSVRAQAVSLWSQSTRWSLRIPEAAAQQYLVPAVDADDDGPSDGVWLELALGVPVQVRASLQPGSATARQGVQRVRLIDVYISSPPGAMQPVSLRVDDQRWLSPQLFGVQRHRIALAEGIHELVVEGPPGTRAWSTVPAIEPRQTERHTRREQLWSLPDTSWHVHGPKVAGSVRLRLRWPEQLAPRPVRITMHEAADGTTDASSRRTIVFDPRVHTRGQTRDAITIDADAVPLADARIVGAAPGRVSLRHDVTLPIAATTRRVWFEVEDQLPVLGSLALRRGLRSEDLAGPPGKVVDAPPFDELAGLAETDIEAELAQLSSRLLTEPGGLDLRARRAALLLLLGESGLARADLFVLSAWAESERASIKQRERAQWLLGQLEARFDALIEPHEAIVPAGASAPMLIEPALAAVIEPETDELDAWLRAWSRARDRTVDEALRLLDDELERLRSESADPRQLLLGELAKAHWLSRDPTRARAAGQLWLELYDRLPGPIGRPREPLAVGVAAATPMLAHLDDPASDARDAGLAYGLCMELLPRYSHTTLRRLAFVAAVRSEWHAVVHAEQSAGFELLEVPHVEIEDSASTRVYDAILAAPWMAEGERAGQQQLRAGRQAVLAWDAQPGRVSVELWCRATRPDLTPERAGIINEPTRLGSAELTARLIASTGTIERSVEIDDGRLTTLELPIETRDRHQLELRMSDDPMWTCSARAWAVVADETRDAASTELIEARQRRLWTTVDTRHGATYTVLGPATVDIEVRPVEHRRLATPTRLRVDIDGAARGGELTIDARVDPAVVTERGRKFEVGHASGHTLLLSEARPHRIHLRTDQGRALVRLRVRSDRAARPPPTQVSLRELELVVGSLPDPQDRGRMPFGHARGRDAKSPLRNRVGTVDALVRVGLDEVGDNDDFQPRFGTDVQIGWRRALIDDWLWLRIAAQSRVREHSPAAGGGLLSIGARVPVLGLRLGASVDVLAHPYDGVTATSVRALGFIDRPTWLSRRVQLRPRVDLGYRWQSLDRARVRAATTGLEPHPRVYLRYIEDHPLLLRPELALRLYPLQDLVLYGEASLLPNNDLRSLDHTDVEAGLLGIGRMPSAWVPFWGAGYQASLRFADDDRSQTRLRHRVDASVGVGTWIRDAARVALGVEGQTYFTAGLPVRVVFDVWLRVDAVLGRRMRDFAPGQLWFGELWAPRGWANDERQAGSTQGWLRR